MVTSVKCRPRWRQKGSRSAPTENCPFAALLPLLVLLAGGVPALAADSIEDLLQQQDETDSHNDALRRDLNALTEEQWQYYFKVERKRPDIELDGQLMVHETFDAAPSPRRSNKSTRGRGRTLPGKLVHRLHGTVAVFIR